MVVKRNYTQKNRRIAISTPLGEDRLLLRSINGTEAISRLYNYHLELLSEDDAIDFSAIVGQRVNVRILLADLTERHFNGFVSRFSQGGRDGVLTSYHAELVPWLWFLTRTADCRIFQNKSVPDIIQQIFKDLGFQDYELRLYGNFAPREYCVQYRETDFNFVSRLMEEIGIFYFFEHTDSTHKLILANDAAAIKACPNQPKVRYELSAGGWQDDDVITGWRVEQSVRPGKWTQTDYNFETPSTSLLISVEGPNPMEIYDYPGEYATRKDGDTLTKIRLEGELAPGLVAQAESDCRALGTGFKVELEEHYRSDLNAEWLVTEIHHRASQGGDYATGTMEANDEDFSYQNQFTCIPATVSYRPERLTQRPTVRGCQTAVVVGPAGEEIHTDKFGRVKIQFHWDREGKRDENSSCWTRVSQVWAGQGWGSVSIPRIGQEVVVDFLEGDPDRPLIVGRVYNAEQMPPNGLPSAGMVSGIKSNSTPGGGGYNEMTMDDTKGKEKVTIHAQYDMSTTVQHDQTTTVNNCQSETIIVDKSSNVGSNKTVSVGGNHTETVTGNQSITVNGTHTESITGMTSQTVSAAKAESIALAKALSIGAAYQVSVGAAMNETIAGLKAEEIGAAKIVMVGGASKELIAGSKSVTAGGKVSTKAGGSISENAASKIAMVAGSSLAAAAGGKMSLSSRGQFSAKGSAKGVIDMGSQLTLKCGGASITLKSGGDILIKGTNIKLKGSSKVAVDGSGGVTLKGAKISEN